MVHLHPANYGLETTYEYCARKQKIRATGYARQSSKSIQLSWRTVENRGPLRALRGHLWTVSVLSVVGSLKLSGGISSAVLKTQAVANELNWYLPPPRLSSFRLHGEVLLELKHLCAGDDWHDEHLKASCCWSYRQSGSRCSGVWKS